MTMDIRVYRERPASSESAKSHAQALWTYLLSQPNSKPKPSAVGLKPVIR